VDLSFWQVKLKEIAQSFKGDLVSHEKLNGVIKTECFDFRNSGANAISLAAWLGAEKIILLGYDCSIKKGFHWHGQHKKPLTNCTSIKHWPGIFEKVAKAFGHVEIINCTRETELECFKRDKLESVLHGLN